MLKSRNSRIFHRPHALWHVVYLLVALIASASDAFGQVVGSKLWSFQTGGAVSAASALGHDGIIYVGSENHRLYALSPNGSKRWEFVTADKIVASPVVASDGTILVGSSDGILYSVSTNGTERWRFLTGNAITEPPAISVNGTAYVVSSDGNLYALNPNGSERWRFKTDTLNNGSVPAPSVGFDGTVYVSSTRFLGTFSARLNALDTNGAVKWSFTLPQYAVGESVLLDTAGSIYVGDTNQKLFALDSAGKLKWNQFTKNTAIGGAGRLFGTWEGRPVARRADGSDLWWIFSLGTFPTTTPAIAADGTIYYGTDKGILMALDGDGALKWGFESRSSIQSAPLITPNGTVIFGANDGNLYAVKGTNGPAPSVWPMYRGNAQRTGALWNTVVAETELALRMFPGLTISGTLGTSYRIEYRNAVDDQWAVLSNVVIDRTPYQFFDVNSNGSKRFYRAVQLP